MNHKVLLLRTIGLTLVTLLVAACGTTQPAAVQRVKAFHRTINAIELGEGGEIGMGTLQDIVEEHTTTSLVPPSLLTVAGIARFSNMEYELVSESPECAVVKAIGDMGIMVAGETTTMTYEEEYVVVKQGERWLIDLGADSCD